MLNRKNAGHSTTNLSSELQLLSELPPSLTPDILFASLERVQSRESAAAPDTPDIKAMPSAAGHFRSTRDVLISHALADSLIDHLRQTLVECEKKPTTAATQNLIEAWIAVEPCLTEGERSELHKQVLSRAFPKSRDAGSMSRNSLSRAQGE